MITWSLANLFQFISFIAPSLIAFFLLMASIFNQNLKGLVYLAGSLFAACVNRIAQHIISTKPGDRPIACSFFDGVFPFKLFGGTDVSTQPSASSMFIAYTTTYLILPMYYNNLLNYPIIITFLGFFIINGWTNIANSCTPATGVLLGGLIGTICAITWFSLFHSSGLDKLLYFSETASNKVMCEKPTEQQFKCSVYKGGELISSNFT
tara:strand:+ start:2265 stop:2888 length:624 start_codon:yes stop_codon:yes gene_type:complete